MEITFKTTSLFLAILLTGLSAGLFYAWEVSVIPGTKIISDTSYLETMQAINRAILNPLFFIIFFGSLLFLGIASFPQYLASVNMKFWLIIASFAIYLIGTFGVTVFFNLPLNEALDLVKLNQLSSEQLEVTRNNYELKWNLWHKLRTVCSVASFTFILISQVFD